MPDISDIDQADGELAPSAPVQTSPKRAKRTEDTIAGCEAHAASDLTRAAAMSTMNGRMKLEHSAAAWQGRADMLQRMADSFDKRKALDQVERDSATSGRHAPGFDGE